MRRCRSASKRGQERSEVSEMHWIRIFPQNHCPWKTGRLNVADQATEAEGAEKRGNRRFLGTAATSPQDLRKKAGKNRDSSDLPLLTRDLATRSISAPPPQVVGDHPC